MEYPFRVCGRFVEVCRFRVDYSEERPGEGGEVAQIPTVHYCTTHEEADAVVEQTDGTVTAMDTAAYEWLDGIEVADVPDTYAEGVRIYELGEAVYLAAIDAPSEMELAQQAITDQELNNMETNQRITDLELMILGGGAGV